jgi:hypothetical protein
MIECETQFKFKNRGGTLVYSGSALGTDRNLKKADALVRIACSGRVPGIFRSAL